MFDNYNVNWVFLNKNWINMETVLITGGTGNIGKKLSNLLLSRGYCVAVLTRKKKHTRFKN